MKATLPVFALITLLSTQAFGASDETATTKTIFNPFAYMVPTDDGSVYVTSVSSGVISFSNGISVSTLPDGGLVISGIPGSDNNTTHLPFGTTYTIDKDLNEVVFRTDTHSGSMPISYDDGEVDVSGMIHSVLSSNGTSYSVVQDRYGKTYIVGKSSDNKTIDEIITINQEREEGASYIVSIGKYETLEFPDGYTIESKGKNGQYLVVYLNEGYTEEDLKEVLDSLSENDDKETPTIVVVELPKKPVEVHPTLAIHNVFRNNMFSVLNRIKPHQSVTSDKQYYVQSFKGTKTSHVESTTSELNTRVYIESTSLYSNIKNKETLRQTGGTVGFDYENIGFCFTDLTGELNQYDLDSRLYSVYAGFNDQHKVVLSYGDHDLGQFDGDSYGALYEFNYDNFVADVAYTNTKFDQENLKTYMVGVGYTVAGNVVGPINGSIKGMVIQDFGDHKDQYGAKQGSTGILVSGMLQTNLTNNLAVYLMANGEVRRHVTGASVALGLELAF
jgi:hypothetical protein